MASVPEKRRENDSQHQQIDPMPVIIGAAEYPENVIEEMIALGVDIDAIDALTPALEAGSAKAVNIVLMGRLAARHFDIPREKWTAAIEQSVARSSLK